MEIPNFLGCIESEQSGGTETESDIFEISDSSENNQQINELTVEDYAKLLGGQSNGLIVLGTSWCQPCQIIDSKLPTLPIIPKIKIYTSTSENPMDIGDEEHGISSLFGEIYHENHFERLPAALLIKGGRVMGRFETDDTTTPEKAFQKLSALMHTE